MGRVRPKIGRTRPFYKKGIAMKGIATHRISLVLVAGCTTAIALAASLAATPSADAASPEMDQATAWSIELDCAACHGKEATSLETGTGNAPAAEKTGQAANANETAGSVKTAGGDTTSGATDTGRLEAITDFASDHAANMGLTCTDCHRDSPELAAAHAKLDSGKEPRKLKKTAVESDTCLACHDQESLAEQTTGSAVLSDENGTVVNPHELPGNPEHEQVSCTDCHRVHNPKKTVDTAAQQACTSCHHTGVYECGTCHEA